MLTDLLKEELKFSVTQINYNGISQSPSQFLKCNQKHIMVSVIGAVPLQYWCLPSLGIVQPVGMINPSSFNVSGFSHQLDESNIFKSLGNKVPWILLQAEVEVTSDQSSIT